MTTNFFIHDSDKILTELDTDKYELLELSVGDFTNLGYFVDNGYQVTLTSLIQECNTRNANRHSIFMGVGFGAFLAMKLASNFHARAYLICPIISPTFYLNAFIGQSVQTGRPVLTEEMCSTYSKSDIQTEPILDNRFSVMLNKSDIVTPERYVQQYYTDHAMHIDSVVDNGVHDIDDVNNISLMTSRILELKDEEDVAYAVRKSELTVSLIRQLFK